jgi:hypothetical protein
MRTTFIIRGSNRVMVDIEEEHVGCSDKELLTIKNVRPELVTDTIMRMIVGTVVHVFYVESTSGGVHKCR